MSEEEGQHRKEGRDDPRLEWFDLFPIYHAPDEPTAIHVQAFLTASGIDARIRSAQIPGLDGVHALAIGYWGQVLVPRREVIRARVLLEEFLEEIGGQGGSEGAGDVGGAAGATPEPPPGGPEGL